MDPDKYQPVRVADMVRKFSGRHLELTTDSEPKTPLQTEMTQEKLLYSRTQEEISHSRTQAQVATTVSTSNQNSSGGPSYANKKTKKRPPIPKKPKLDRPTIQQISQLKESSRNSIKKKLVYMFEELRKIIESKDYAEELKECLGKASPDYLNKIAERTREISESDHGIVITGETSAGKSTLVNKILGMRIFKGRNIESTSTVCKIRNSANVMIRTELDTGEVKVKYMNDVDVKTEQGVKTLRHYLKTLTDLTIAKGSKTYKCVDIGMPVSFLKDNTIMVDTPGIGGSGELSHKVVEYLSNAASFIFVINVASAGGMQKDRLPEILKLIISMQMDDEKPWFDPSSVIFITNKWDNIKNDPDDSSDENETDKTWRKLTYSIKRSWPSVRKENIFKMNLTDVYREKKSTVEFEKFLKTLERMVKENEIIRMTEHFRYLCALLEDVCTGIQTRKELINKTKDEQKRKGEEHQMKINVWKEKCKYKGKAWRIRIETFIENQAEEILKHMSSETGKEEILNPKDWEPIMDVPYVPYSLGSEVQERIDHYVTKKVQRAEVVAEFKKVKDDVLNFYREISSEMENMEKEWKGTYDERNRDKDGTIEEESVGPNVAGVIAMSPLWFPILAAGFAVAVAAVPLVVPVFAILGSDSRRRKIIDEEYEKRKPLIKDNVRDALKSNHWDALDKLIRKVAAVNLVRRIQFMEEIIKDLSENREKILKNNQRLTGLSEKIKYLNDMAEEIKISFI